MVKFIIEVGRVRLSQTNLISNIRKVGLWLQSRLRLDVKYFGVNAGILSLEQVAKALSGFLVAWVWANFASKEIFGMYNFVLSAVGALSFTALPGMPAAVARGVSLGREGIFRRATLGILKASGWGSVGLVLIGIYIFFQDQVDVAIALLLAGSVFPLLQAGSLWRQFLIGRKQFSKILVVGLLFAFVNPLILAASLIFFNGVVWVISLSLGGQILISGLVTVKLLKSANKKHRASDLGFGNKTSFVRAVQKVAVNVDPLILAWFLDFEAVAIYSFGLIMPNFLMGWLKSLCLVSLPKMTKVNWKTFEESMMMRLGQITLVGGLLMLAYWVGAGVLFKSLFSTYIDSL